MFPHAAANHLSSTPIPQSPHHQSSPSHPSIHQDVSFEDGLTDSDYGWHESFIHNQTFDDHSTESKSEDEYLSCAEEEMDSHAVHLQVNSFNKSPERNNSLLILIW